MGATRPASGKIVHVSYDDWHVPTRDASPPFGFALCAGALLEMPRHETHPPQPCSQELLFNLITL